MATPKEIVIRVYEDGQADIRAPEDMSVDEVLDVLESALEATERQLAKEFFEEEKTDTTPDDSLQTCWDNAKKPPKDLLN